MLDGLFLFWLGFVICVSVNSFISGLVTVALGKLMGFDVYYFKYLFFDMNTINQAKTINKGQFSPLCQHLMWQPDAEKRVDKKDNAFAWISIAVETITGIILLLCIIYITHICKDTGAYLANQFFNGVAVSLVSFIIIKPVTGIRILLTINKRLSHYRINEIKRLSAGASWEELQLPPYKELGLISPDYEIIPYDCLRFNQLVWLERYEEISELVEEMEAILRKSDVSFEYMKSYTNAYYDMIFYYSFVRYDKLKAMHFYNIISQDLKNDVDSNGRRVLAYYEYYIRNDEAKARELVDEAWKVIDKFGYDEAGRDYEAKLLKLLTEKMDGKEC